ncbi:DMT family transporter [Phytoactinopolyspora halotolerans]|uniref:EamA family transporter n=1 Tax=Phytoactinopolyspora halotolerans TaxID=1981512 RepID=A0A6L9SCZ2_9ACTN|nr:DMT family transporter [Phytoactinopolyspora halotolerans]NEE01900.1 EamA family transporter [Phytoactinopolyspora halotolerans]
MSKRGWGLFLAMSLIWGIPYLLIKVAVEDLSPATIVFGRTAIGAALLLPVAIARGYLRPVLRHWRALLAFTAIEICMPWLLLGYAEQRLSSSLTGLLIAAVPLVGAVLVTATGHERIDGRRVVGLLVGLVGVAALVGFDVATGDLWAVAAIGGVAIGYAVGPIILARHLAGLPGLGVMALALSIAAVAYVPVGIAQWPSTTPESEVWLSVAGLGLICTALAFVVFYQLIAEVGPARSTVITYVNPAVALVLGIVILDESFTVTTAIGFALILTGCVLATARDRKRGMPRPEPQVSGA